MRVNDDIGKETLLLETNTRKYYKTDLRSGMSVIDIYTKDPFEIEAGNTILRTITCETEEDLAFYVDKLEQGIDPYEGYTNEQIKKNEIKRR